jgi:hypothetical protein
MHMRHGFEVYLGCNNSHLAGFVNSLHLPFHMHSPVLPELLSPKLQPWPHTSFVLELPEHLSLQEAPPGLGQEQILLGLDKLLQG